MTAARTAAERVSHELHDITGRYYRLVLLVGPTAAAETTLGEIERRTGAPHLNVSLELSRRLFELPLGERPRSVLRLLEETLGDNDPVLLGCLELLFEPSLAQDPLRLLQQISRGRTLAAVWPGTLEDGDLAYAEPVHPEHRRYSPGEARIVLL